MSLRSLVLACAAAAFSPAAQAAELRLGLHSEYASAALPDVLGGFALPGVGFSATSPVTEGLNLRGSVALDLPGLIRVDGTLLGRGEVYFGGGLGTGVFLLAGDLIPTSALALTNVHAVVGKNFGPLQAEAYARLGLVYGLGVNVTYLLAP